VQQDSNSAPGGSSPVMLARYGLLLHRSDLACHQVPHSLLLVK
jgi:hypothetical protein